MIFIDGHVHLWQNFDLDLFFQTAFTNFTLAANSFSPSQENLFVMFLAETKQEKSSKRLEKLGMVKNNCNYSQNISYAFLNLTENIKVLKVRHLKSDKILFIIFGQQITCSEGIEILSFFTPHEIENENPILDIIDKITLNSGIVVIPWGVGKWLGRRGKIIENTLDSLGSTENVFIGDNANRPWFWPSYKIEQLAHRYDTGILSGSDPLNIKKGFNNIGSYGTILDIPTFEIKHISQIKSHLINSKSHMKQFGKPQKALPFLYTQVATRLNNKLPLSLSY